MTNDEAVALVRAYPHPHKLIEMKGCDGKFDGEADLRNARKRWPAVFTDAAEADPGDFSFDPAAIEADVKARILPREAEASKKKSSPPQPSTPDLASRVNALVYHGDCDEGTELFGAACRFIYKFHGLGLNVEAETVYLWAAEWCRQSALDPDAHGTVRGH